LPPAAILKKIKVAFLYEVKRKARDYEFESWKWRPVIFFPKSWSYVLIWNARDANENQVCMSKWALVAILTKVKVFCLKWLEMIAKFGHQHFLPAVLLKNNESCIFVWNVEKSYWMWFFDMKNCHLQPFGW
jgi:hypothetical protein